MQPARSRLHQRNSTCNEAPSCFELLPDACIHRACRCIRYVISTLSDAHLHALLLLSIFPTSFGWKAAAELLGMTECPSRARGLLRTLSASQFLQYNTAQERYVMHPSIRICCRSLADELGLSHKAAR